MINSESICKIIEDTVVGFDASALTEEANFIESGLDSLDLANILFSIEDEFSVTIPDEAVPECSSISGIIKFVKKQK